MDPTTTILLTTTTLLTRCTACTIDAENRDCDDTMASIVLSFSAGFRCAKTTYFHNNNAGSSFDFLLEKYMVQFEDSVSVKRRLFFIIAKGPGRGNATRTILFHVTTNTTYLVKKENRLTQLSIQNLSVKMCVLHFAEVKASWSWS